MGRIDQKPGEFVYWDDRCRRPRRPDLPYWDDRNRRPHEPDIFEQAERQIQELRRGAAQSITPGDVTWAVRPVDDWAIRPMRLPAAMSNWEISGSRGSHDTPGFVNDEGDLVGPDDPGFESRLGEWLSKLLADGIITLEQLNELFAAKYARAIPTRRELAEQRLRQMLREDVIDQRQFNDLLRDVGKRDFKIHKNPLYYQKILKYCYLLEEIRGFMDDWIQRGMPVQPGSHLEAYLIAVGKRDSLDRYGELPPPEGMTQREWKEYRQVVESASFGLGRKVTEKELRDIYDRHGKYNRLVKRDRSLQAEARPAREEAAPEVYVERARRLVSGAWAVFREDVSRTIEISRNPDLVGLGNMGWFAAGLNMPGIGGYTLDSGSVQSLRPLTVLEIMVHEPLHDFARYRFGHSAMSGWKHVETDAGWDMQGNWDDALDTLMSYVLYIMNYTSSCTGSKSGEENCWKAALRRSGIDSR